MTPEEERRAKAAENKRAYRLRKKQEEQARMQDFRRIAEATPNPLSKEQQEQTVQQILEANPAIIVTDKANLHELEEQLSKQVSSKEKAEAAVSEAVAREEYVNYLFSPYAKVTNIPQLLQAILREQITLRVTITDLIGGLNK